MIFNGCARATKRQRPEKVEPLRQPVGESFFSSIQDPSVRRYLDSVDPNGLPPERRMEVQVLRSIRSAETEHGFQRAFDRLWGEEEHIRMLLDGTAERDGYLHPLAELYYLLSSMPAQSWQRRTAEALYNDTLQRMKPHQLSGYALHFYTLALLRNGHVDAALPFLFRLEHFTTPAVYSRDLVIALGYVTDAKEYQAASRLIGHICRVGLRSNIRIPEDLLQATILEIQQTRNADFVIDELAPVLSDHPGIQEYGFVKMLSAHAGPSDHPLGNGRHEVYIQVHVIKAGKERTYIDPVLGEIGKALTKTLHYTSYELEAMDTFHLKTGEKGEMPLTGKSRLRVIVQSLKQDSSRIEVTVLDGRQEVLRTVVESADKGVTTIGGPRVGDEVLLLRISTFIT
jgi:hypothetical protein